MWHTSYKDYAPKFVSLFNSRKKRKYRTLETVKVNGQVGTIIDVNKQIQVMVTTSESYYVDERESTDESHEHYDLALIRVLELAHSYNHNYDWRKWLFLHVMEEKNPSGKMVKALANSETLPMMPSVNPFSPFNRLDEVDAMKYNKLYY